MKDYKIEVKPTLWNVVLFHGEYSDYNEDHFYIHANDRIEAWHQFKRYWQDTYNPYRPLLVLKGSDQRTEGTFEPEGWKKTQPYGDVPDDEEPDFDPTYGYANGVYLFNVAVIEFKR